MKRVFALMAALLMSLSLINCGKKKKDDDAPKPPAATKPTPPAPAAHQPPKKDEPGKAAEATISSTSEVTKNLAVAKTEPKTGKYAPVLEGTKAFLATPTMVDLENKKVYIYRTNEDVYQLASTIRTHVRSLASVIHSTKKDMMELAKNYGTQNTDTTEKITNPEIVKVLNADTLLTFRIAQLKNAYMETKGLLQRLKTAYDHLDEAHFPDVEAMLADHLPTLNSVFDPKKDKETIQAAKETWEDVITQMKHITRKDKDNIRPWPVQDWFLNKLETVK